VAIIKYDDVKEKPSTLRAMTSLEREEFEELRVAFGEAWERQRQAAGYDPSQGGRPPQLAAIKDKLLFIFILFEDLSASGSPRACVWAQSRAGECLDSSTE